MATIARFFPFANDQTLYGWGKLRYDTRRLRTYSPKMKTKIIVTLGPRCETEDVLREMTKAGMSMLRLNFSHATYEQYRRIAALVRKINKSAGTSIKVLLDLQGPRIRVGKIADEGMMLADGQVVKFCYASGATHCPAGVIPIDSKELHVDIKKGDPFFLANGDLELVVTKVKDGIIVTEVVKGGLLLSRKGINVPRTMLRSGGLTAKDIKDVKFGMKEGADYVALSFVQSAADVEKLRKVLGVKSKVQIISKIERGLALDNIDEIIRASDGIMVARGDLGIEVPIENLPIVQKNIVRHAHWHNKPAIIATQVLTSMIQHPHPTRAEVSDIANAIFDGADAIMLSDETTVGQYPIESVRMLHKVINRTEQYLANENFFDVM